MVCCFAFRKFWLKETIKSQKVHDKIKNDSSFNLSYLGKSEDKV